MFDFLKKKKLAEEKFGDIGFGCKKDRPDKRDFRISSIQGTVDLPAVFSLDDKFPHKNQFSRGSCTCQSASSHKEMQEDIACSARFLMARVKEFEGNKNYGAYTRNAMKMVNEKGVCEESIMPEPPREISWDEYINVDNIPCVANENALKHKSKSFWRVDALPEPIKQAIYQNRVSVVISMAWYKEFMNPPVSGILQSDYKEENYLDGHAVNVKGWNNNIGAVLVKNSWGKNWGLKGDFYLPYSFFPKLVWDAWSSLDIPAEMPVDLRYGQQRTWNMYLQEKAMAFNPWLTKKIGRFPNNREISGLVYGKHDWTTIFLGVNGDVWLNKTKPALLKEGFNYKT